MSKPRVLIFIVALCAIASACSNDGVTTPTPSASSYAGEWSGTTSQGAPISFSVSADQVVTSITVGHRFNGCSGSNTFANLSLTIATTQLPFPPRVPTPDSSGFGYGSGPPEEANYTQVLGNFPSAQASTGSVAFLNFPSCGNAVANWNATKR
jgi:hypothetical protein